MSIKNTFLKLKNELIRTFPHSEAEFLAFVLLEKVTNLSKTNILLNHNYPLTNQQNTQLHEYLQRALTHEPWQYIVGEVDFLNLKLAVTPAVLIPRPETEEWVAKLIAYHKKDSFRNILDIGTGSGCIAIALAKAFPQAYVKALDISEKALQVALQNAQKNAVELNYEQCDVLTWQTSQTYDLIVSNPPYVCESEKSSMQKNVLDYEPPQALFVPDSQPLLFYEKIIQIAHQTLSKKGWLYVELNPQYSKDIQKLFKRYGFEVEVWQDFTQQDRIVRAFKKIIG